MPNTQAIELRQVTKRFGRQVAVDGLDLVVPEGTIYGFVGPNGSGKTTTLRMILRIYRPDAGEVIVLGSPQGRTADDRLGYLPEERGLYKRMRVRSLLRYYARLKGNYDCRREIDQWLERLGATAWSHKRIDTLSKGMAQKVQFIGAVIAKPRLLILDEPFSGLDPVNMQVLQDAVIELRQRGTTVVFSTHDMDVAERMCDYIFMIFRGRKVLDGTLDQIQADYPADLLRVRFADPSVELPPIESFVEHRREGPFHRFRWPPAAESDRLKSLMTALADHSTLVHFEVIRPSLREIFVRIARPDAGETPAIEEGESRVTAPASQ